MPRKRWPTKHDTILVYVKDPRAYWFDSDAVDRDQIADPVTGHAVGGPADGRRQCEGDPDRATGTERRRSEQQQAGERERRPREVEAASGEHHRER